MHNTFSPVLVDGFSKNDGRNLRLLRSYFVRGGIIVFLVGFGVFMAYAILWVYLFL